MKMCRRKKNNNKEYDAFCTSLGRDGKITTSAKFLNIKHKFYRFLQRPLTNEFKNAAKLFQ